MPFFPFQLTDTIFLLNYVRRKSVGQYHPAWRRIHTAFERGGGYGRPKTVGKADQGPAENVVDGAQAFVSTLKKVYLCHASSPVCRGLIPGLG